MDIDNFEMITLFDDISVLPYLGEEIHTITEPVLMDIGLKVHEYDKREYQKKLENAPIQGQMEFKLDGKEVIYDIKSKANTATEGIYGREQELIQKSIETAITSKPPTSLHKRLNDKQIEANVLNSKRVVKSAMKRQKGMGL